MTKIIQPIRNLLFIKKTVTTKIDTFTIRKLQIDQDMQNKQVVYQKIY